jgi:uncharacterized protein
VLVCQINGEFEGVIAHQVFNMRLTVKVIPGASRDEVVGMLGDALKVKVRAQPERGKANAAVVALLAKYFAISENDIEVCAGHTSRLKQVDIKGLGEEYLARQVLADE